MTNDERFSRATRTKVSSMLDGESAKYLNNISLIAEVGSTAHGISVGDDDLDLIVVWTEPLVDLMNLNAKGTRMIRTQPEGTRSGPGDIDLQVYSMRKFTSLVVAGNPSLIAPLFAPPQMQMANTQGQFPGNALAEMAHTKAAGRRFLGYMNAQVSRWEEGRIKSRVSRPELIDAHGYDTKYAAHALRLGWQGLEFLDTGRMTIPMRPVEAGWLREVRAGQVDESDALRLAFDQMHRLEGAIKHSTLPEGPDMGDVYRFLANWHRGR